MIIFWCVIKIILFFRVALLNITFFWSICLSIITILMLLLKKNEEIQQLFFKYDLKLMNTPLFQFYLRRVCFYISALFGKVETPWRIRDYIYLYLKFVIIISFIGFFFFVRFNVYESILGIGEPNNLVFILIVCVFYMLKVTGWFLAMLGFTYFYFDLSTITYSLSADNKFILNQEELRIVLADVMFRIYPRVKKGPL
jgi:hypothetical protein